MEENKSKANACGTSPAPMEENKSRANACGTSHSAVVPTFSRDQALLRPNQLFSSTPKKDLTVKPNKENENPVDNFPKSRSATESLSPQLQTMRIFPGSGDDAIKKHEAERQRPYGSLLTVKRDSHISSEAEPHGQMVEEEIVEDGRPTYLLGQVQDLISKDEPNYGQESDLNQEAEIITQQSQYNYGK